MLQQIKVLQKKVNQLENNSKSLLEKQKNIYPSEQQDIKNQKYYETMNILQTFLVIGLFGMFLVFAIAPVTNVASNAIDNANVYTGFAGFFFGNLTFIIFIVFIIVILMMMWTG